MKTTAFKSEYTGELFETKKEYNLHIKKYKIQKKEAEKQNLFILKSKEMRQMPRLTAVSIEDFREKAFNIINVLNDNNPDKFLGLFIEARNFGWVSDTHSAPIGGEQNFSQNDDKPKGYNGWNGRITFILSEEKNTGENRNKIENLIQRFPGINIGCGGYGGNEYDGIKGYVLSYELRLYLDDFPILKSKYKKYLKLQDNYQQWNEKVNKLFEEKNNSDEEMISYKNVESELSDQFHKIENKLNNISKSINLRQQTNNQQILSDNPFAELGDLEDLEIKLKIK